MSGHPTNPDSKNVSAPRGRRWTVWLALAVVAAVAVWLFQGQRVFSQSGRNGGRAGNVSSGQPAPAPATQNGTPAGRGGRGGRAGAGGAVPVAAAKARTGNMPVYLDGLGSVAAFYTVTVHPRVDGQLMYVAFKEGDYVRQGQILAEIDPRPFRAQLLQAQGQMQRDQALLANARLDLSRYQTLLAENAIPSQQLDTQRATVGQYEGAVKQDQAAIDTAQLQLTYAHVTAPITGRIGLRLVDPGNIVHAGDANGLLVITQLRPIAVYFTIPEDSLPPVLRKLRAGSRLPVYAYNRDKTRMLATGYLLTTDNQIDPQTGTTRLKAIFENRESILWPNQFVNIRLLVDTRRNQVIIPAVAVQHGQQGTFVYAIKPDNTVEVRNVQTGLAEANDISIVSGLKAGETVVTDGTDRLRAGAKVRIRPEAAPAPAPGVSPESPDQSGPAS